MYKCLKYLCIAISPALNEGSVLQHFECCNVIEIPNRIMFDLCPRLLHMCNYVLLQHLIPWLVDMVPGKSTTMGIVHEHGNELKGNALLTSGKMQEMPKPNSTR